LTERWLTACSSNSSSSSSNKPVSCAHGPIMGSKHILILTVSDTT
jgi:hypothetical protein